MRKKYYFWADVNEHPIYNSKRFLRKELAELQLRLAEVELKKAKLDLYMAQENLIIAKANFETLK